MNENEPDELLPVNLAEYLFQNKVNSSEKYQRNYKNNNCANIFFPCALTREPKIGTFKIFISR